MPHLRLPKLRGRSLTPAPVFVEALADAIESLLRRLGGVLDLIDSVITGLVGLTSTAMLFVPSFVSIAIVGLAVWGGRRLFRAVLVVLASQLVVFSGSAEAVVETLSFALVVGSLGVAIVPIGRAMARWLPGRVHPPDRPFDALLVAVLVVAVIALTSMLSGVGSRLWGLTGLLLAVVLVGLDRWCADLALVWPQVPRAIVVPGLSASLLLGLVSATGISGLAARASATGDVALTLQVVIALTGMAIALAAVSWRDLADLEESRARGPEPMASDAHGGSA